mgnify:CR=1 FL=1
MFTINDDLSIYATRGDTVFFKVTADDDGAPYKFQAGDVLRIKIYEKKNAANVILEKEFGVTGETEMVDILLTEKDTKFGEVISKPVDYWYEIELNPYTNPQTIIGYDEDGAKIFRLFPEGKDSVYVEPDPEEIPIVDDELSMTSTRPVQNQAISRAIVNLEAAYNVTKAEVKEKADKTDASLIKFGAEIGVERARIDNLLSGATADDAELLDVRVGADGVAYLSAGTAVREQFKDIGTKEEVLRKELARYNGILTIGFSGVIQSKTFDYKTCLIHTRNGYVSNSGSIEELPKYNYSVYKFDVLSNARYVVFKQDSDWSMPTYSGVIAKKDGTFHPISSLESYGYKLNITDCDYILLNIDESSKMGFNCFTVWFNPQSQVFDTNKIACDLTNVVGTNQYVHDGVYTEFSKSSFGHISEIKVESGYSYYLKETAFIYYGCCYDESGQFLGNIELGNNDAMIFAPKTVYAHVNISPDAYVYAEVDEVQSEIALSNVLNKPYAFKDKTAVFYGDSITSGVYSGDGALKTTQECYVKHFAEKVGFSSYRDYGVSSSCFATNIGSTTSILTKVTQEGNIGDYDYIFIAGGTNDFGNNVVLGAYDSGDTTTVCGALAALMKHLKESITEKQEVIFILPINRSSENNAKNNAGRTLTEYRKVIYDLALANGFSVVNGADFGFPTNHSDEKRKPLLYDGLHPTLLGHKQYAKALSTMLC